MSGTKEGQIEIDFGKVTSSDSAGASKYEVAGRLYWEAHIFAPSFVSFTTNGFFDRQGYEEPQLPSKEVQILLAWLIPVIVVLLLIALICYIRHRDH